MKGAGEFGERGRRVRFSGSVSSAYGVGEVAGIAVLVAVVHWVAHLGYAVLPLSLGWQDLLLGYPVAALLGVAAALILGSGAAFSGAGRRRSRP